MARLIIIGIDGMDPDVFGKLEEQCPNLARIKRSHLYYTPQSTFPPDSIPAWATIFTGSHPAEHGWLDNVDYEDLRRGKRALDISLLQGNTFWDKAGEQGYRVCVVNPLLAYPVWPVNGVMVSGPVFISGESQAYPEDVAAEYRLPALGGMIDFPVESRLKDFVEKAVDSTKAIAQFGRQLYAREKWDLFFISFFTLDRVQHFLWRYYDKNDPTHPGANEYESAIPRFYRLFDDIVGSYIALADDDTTLMVISDHGHGMRPMMQFNVNELLRRNGLLRTDGAGQVLSPKRLLESSKNSMLGILSSLGLENWSYSIGAVIPKRYRKPLKKSSFLIDKANSMAWASEMGGGTATGGIEINPVVYKFGTQSYMDVARQITNMLNQYHVGEKGGPGIVNWASIMDGPKPEHYPSITFELENSFSVGRALFTDIVTKAPRHQRISGGHRSRGVLFWFGNRRYAEQVTGIEQYHQLILNTLAKALE